MSSTLIPDFPDFPYLDPPAPQSHAIPLSKKRKVRLTERRNLQHETADLSEEEEEVDDMLRAIKDRGLEFYIPLGRTATAQEERADANLDSASSSEASMTPVGGSDAEGENGADGGDDDDDSEDEDDDMDDDGSDEDEDEDDDDGSEEEDLDASMEDLDEDEETNSRYDNTGEFDVDRNFPIDPRQLPT